MEVVSDDLPLVCEGCGGAILDTQAYDIEEYRPGEPWHVDCMEEGESPREETIGELAARLPPGQWIELPEYGVRVKRLESPTLPDIEAP